jgi:hypothetical protein
MKIVRILGYAAAFLIILVVVTIGLEFLLASLDTSWPDLLKRAVSVIVTWAVFWVAVWRPMGRRMQREQGKDQGKGKSR